MACSIVFYNKFKYNFENALKMCDEKILQCRSIEIMTIFFYDNLTKKNFKTFQKKIPSLDLT
ncbi:hypothetical protein BpHYR1_042362 [Brachionus plicatilis]|uniref:Uncharacterized protein n=1 Tax=Brachionus plicatilis TaxID=10195 RepID=A0A3M7SKS7_BRAPC|nr:hypothetical protein BpHYR1_042362 [Brachionus plicatilis]